MLSMTVDDRYCVWLLIRLEAQAAQTKVNLFKYLVFGSGRTSKLRVFSHSQFD